MKLPIAVLALMLPAACVQHRAAAPAPQLRAIAMDVNSWGRPVSRWTIDANGNGRYSAPEPGVYDAERIVTRAFAAGNAGFGKIRALLGPVEAHAGKDLPCADRITDQHYGTVRWEGPEGAAATLAFDTGCRDAATRALTERIERADAEMRAWAASGTVVETRKVERP